MKGKKTGGRQKGTPNRTTKEAREFLESIVFGHFDSIDEVLKNMKDEDKAKYIDALNKLLQYILPKKTDITTGDEPLITDVKVTYVDGNKD